MFITKKFSYSFESVIHFFKMLRMQFMTLFNNFLELFLFAFHLVKHDQKESFCYFTCQQKNRRYVRGPTPTPTLHNISFLSITIIYLVVHTLISLLKSNNSKVSVWGRISFSLLMIIAILHINIQYKNVIARRRYSNSRTKFSIGF